MRIEVPDDVGEALRARAAAQGLSLEKWFQKLAEQKPSKPSYTLSELIQQCETQAPLSDEDRAWMDTPPVGREAL